MNRGVTWELLAVVVLAGVGFVDAAIGGQADLAVLLGVIMALSALVAVHTRTHRHRVGLRADLAAWLLQRAFERGTTLDDEVAHAIASFRAGVTPDIDPTASSHV